MVAQHRSGVDEPAPLIRLAAVSLDTDDPEPLARFYERLLGLTRQLDSKTFIALKGAGVLVVVQFVPDHVHPTWPEGAAPKQLHLELVVDDLDTTELFAVSIGASSASHQPRPDAWRVMLDPAGHPFCLTAML